MFTATLPFINNYIDLLAKRLQQTTNRKLTSTQQAWFKYCLTGMLVTNQLNWRGFERSGWGGYREDALSWMFRQAKIDWPLVLQTSVRITLEQYDVREGVLVIDDSDHKRAKYCPNLWKVHKIFDKKTGGYYNGQNVVFLTLVTPTITIPVGFAFYQPDPVMQSWKRQDKKLQKSGVPKSKRPVPPAQNPDYPGKAEIALQLIAAFTKYHPSIQIRSVLADALFGTATFMDAAANVSQQSQVISQLRQDQHIRHKNREMDVVDYFNSHPGVPCKLSIRGGQEIEVTMASARLWVCSHAAKRFVIALRYPGETNYRYLVATDMSWRTQDIAQTYTMRWLIEVFLEDWKLYEGWGQLAKQTGCDGSHRGVSLSLLLDHSLLLHPEQQDRLENKRPACTVGSLRRYLLGESFLEGMKRLLQEENALQQIERWVDSLKTWFALEPSGKHMSGRNLGRQEPTNSLRYRAKEALLSS